MEVLSEEQKKNITKSMMINFARSCLASMKILEKNHNFSDWHLPFYILAAISLESFAKIHIFKKLEKEGKTHEEIGLILKKHTHNLHDLYSPNIIGSNFLSQSNIKKVKLVKVKTGIFRYDFYIKSEKNALQVYNAESIKYGLMTKNENLSFVAYQTSLILKLCKNVSETLRSN